MIPAMNIAEQIGLAKRQIRETQERLSEFGQVETARLIGTVFEAILAQLIDSVEISPIHHVTTVMCTGLDVALGDGLSATETRILLLAALIHDMCLGAAEWTLSFLPVVEDAPKKIRSSYIKEAIGDRRSKLVELAIRQRMLHNEAAARQVPAVLQLASIQTGVNVSTAEVEGLRHLVLRHDLPSIAELKREGGEPIGPADLFESHERMELIFRGLDRFWMVTPFGIDIDLLRDLAAGSAAVDPATMRKRKLESNARRHSEEFGLYASVYAEGIGQFGFIESTLYVSPTAFRKFRLLTNPEPERLPHGRN